MQKMKAKGLFGNIVRFFSMQSAKATKLEPFQVERVIHEYHQRENIPRSYGEDILLTQTEIHMLTVIGEQPGIGTKALAKAKGVTAGAASQMIKKLVQKGLIMKRISADSDAKIELYLTEKGLGCFEEQQRIHREANQKWYRLLDELDDKTYQSMERIINKMEEVLS